MKKNFKNNKLVIGFVVVLMVILISIAGYFKLSKSGIISNSRNIASNPVEVTIGDSLNGQQYFNRGTVLTLNANFKIKDTSKKYYFMWRTYINGNYNVGTDCKIIPTKVWHPTLTIVGTRHATITIYSDSKCKNQVKLYSTRKYYCKSCPSSFTIEYNANGGKGSMASSAITYGVSQKLRKNTFTKSNYYFLGWRVYNKDRQKWICYTDKKRSSSSYADKSVCDKNGYTLYSDGQSVAKTASAGERIVMYAKWQYNYKQGLKKFSGFEKDPSSGSVKATVWPVIKLNIRSSANSTSKILGTVKQGAALKVLDMTNKTNHNKSYVKVSYGGVTGWIDGEYVMINLPDVIPSMIYDITNAYSSVYKNKNNSISNVTGKNLYGSNYTWYKYNPRLGYKEYLAPMRLPSAKKLQEAQSNALKYGNKIKIYDAFRPWSIQMVVKNNLKDSNFKGTRYCVTNKFPANKNSNGSTRCLYEYKGWFIALKLSSHNVGKAVDVSIVNSDDNADIPTQTAMHELSGWAVPTEAKVNQYPGEIAMNSLFTNAGFNYLISEWWHFEDTRAAVSGLENLGRDDKANHLDLAK